MWGSQMVGAMGSEVYELQGVGSHFTCSLTSRITI